MDRVEIWNGSAQLFDWVFPQEVLTQQEHANACRRQNLNQHIYEYWESSNHINENNFVGRDGIWNGSSAAQFPNIGHRYVQQAPAQQERAYEYHNFEPSGYEYEESSNHISENDYVEYHNDEALARAGMMMDVNENTSSNVIQPTIGVHVGESLEHDHEIEPDTMSYEQLQSLGDTVGHENKGLSEKILSKLPSSKYKIRSSNETEQEQCVICYVEFKKGTKVTTLPCKHIYHSECITKWLKINKHCPLCQREVKHFSLQKEKPLRMFLNAIKDASLCS